MAYEKIKIDPEKFAYHFIDSIRRENPSEGEMETASKEALAAYLSAYYLAQRFNNLENKFFDNNNSQELSTYQRILSELNDY